MIPDFMSTGNAYYNFEHDNYNIGISLNNIL